MTSRSFAHPGMEIPAVALVTAKPGDLVSAEDAAAAGLAVAGESGLGPALDPEAKVAYTDENVKGWVR